MNEARSLLGRQAVWQKARVRLSWSEKIRQAEVLRDALLELRRTRPTRMNNNLQTEESVRHGHQPE